MVEATKPKRKRERRYLPGLEAARDHASLSQTDLARMVGLTQESISRLENQERGAHLVTIRKLANALAVHPSTLRKPPGNGEGAD